LAAFPTSHLNSVAPAGLPPALSLAERTRRDLLGALAAEPAKPAYSMVVLSGLISAGEWIALAMAGLVPYYAYIEPQTGPQPLYFAVIALGASSAIILFQSLRVYSTLAFRHPLRAILRLLGGWTMLFLAVFAAMFFLKADQAFSRVWMATWFALGGFLLAIIRIGLSRFVAKLARAGRFQRRAVVVGGGETGGGLLRDLQKADPAEVRILGLFDDRSDARSPSFVEGFPKLGTVDDLIEFARTSRVDLVVFSLPITAEQRILAMLRKLWVLPCDIRLAAHANRLRFRPRSYSYVGQTPMLDIFDKPIAEWDLLIKLGFDKVVGSLALVALSPVLALTALAIKLDSRGSILFKQKRYGFNNEIIEIYIFRSMHTDALDPAASKLVTRDDPRVTRVGRFIRRTSIDELPQLFNVVFKGDLSLVGPRPHAAYAKAADRQYDQVVEGYFARHRVKPGITGWAQINGWRGETDTQEKIQNRVEHDLYYIENWSILFDLRILALTPLSLIKATNAY